MTDTEPQTPPPAPPEPVDLRKTFAYAYVHRSFRLVEACSDVGIDPAQALDLLKDPECTAHISRLISTGEYAGEVMEAREMLEITTSIARTTTSEFISLAVQAGLTEKGTSVLGPQSIPAFMAARLRAVALLSQLKYGKYGNLTALMRELKKARKGRGQSMDRSAIHRAVSELMNIPRPQQQP